MTTSPNSAIPSLEIPDSLPPLTGADKTVTISFPEYSTAIRLLMEYELLLKNTIGSMRHQMDDYIKKHNTLPMAPPEFDNYCMHHTLTLNLIRELTKKSPF